MTLRPFALLLVLPFFLSACSSGQGEARVFSKLSYDEAVARAEKEGKLLFVDATASWCPPCQQMESTTWVAPEVEAWMSAHAIAVQVDVDRDGEVARRLGITAMPTLILFRNGQEVARRRGYAAPGELLAWLEPLAAGS